MGLRAHGDLRQGDRDHRRRRRTGRGRRRRFAQIVADRLGVPIEDVVVLHGDTNVAHYGRDTYGSR